MKFCCRRHPYYLAPCTAGGFLLPCRGHLARDFFGHSVFNTESSSLCLAPQLYWGVCFMFHPEFIRGFLSHILSASGGFLQGQANLAR
jgi:hypothetical protein